MPVREDVIENFMVQFCRNRTAPPPKKREVHCWLFSAFPFEYAFFREVLCMK